MDTRPAGRRFWLWPNLLSLDAPIVALLWQHFLAARFEVMLRPAARIVLGLTVWAIYLADRLLDVRRPFCEGESACHRFYRRHYRFAIVMFALVLGGDLTIAVTQLRPAVIRNGLIPLGGVMIYLTALHVPAEAWRAPKEPLVALLFTAGTFLVAWTNSSGTVEPLVWAAVPFFFLCFANLTAIERWEWFELRGGSDPPHPLTAWFARALPVAALAFAGLALVVDGTAWYRAIALSAAGIAALAIVGRRLSLELRRVLVDAALLSPLLFLR